MTKDVRRRWCDLIGERTAQTLRKHYFDAVYCMSAEEAAARILHMISPEDCVGWGGLATMEALGIQEMLRARGQRLIDQKLAVIPEESEEMRRQSLLCDTFLCGANAVTEDGQLVNMDSLGNRVAALLYGPRQVIVAAGINKICKSTQEGIARIRDIAAPINAQKFPLRGLPCFLTGTCVDCSHRESLCSQLVITRMSRPEGRIKVVLVGEVLGF